MNGSRFGCNFWTSTVRNSTCQVWILTEATLRLYAAGKKSGAAGRKKQNRINLSNTYVYCNYINSTVHIAKVKTKTRCASFGTLPYSYFPRVEGLLDDGINAFSMEYQSAEFMKSLKARHTGVL